METAEREILPLKNVPVTRPVLPASLEPASVARSIAAAVSRWDVNLATDPFGTLNQAASDGEHAIEKTGQDVVQFGGQMVAAATDAAGNVIDWMGDAAKDAANWIGGAAEDTADWVGGVVDDLF